MNDPLVIGQPRGGLIAFSPSPVHESAARASTPHVRDRRFAAGRPTVRSRRPVWRSLSGEPTSTVTTPGLGRPCHVLINVKEFIFVPNLTMR